MDRTRSMRVARSRAVFPARTGPSSPAWSSLWAAHAPACSLVLTSSPLWCSRPADAPRRVRRGRRLERSHRPTR
jgi:hypothetical protein